MAYDTTREKMVELGAFEPDVFRQNMNKVNQRNQGGQGANKNAAGQGAVLGGDKPHLMDRANTAIEGAVTRVAGAVADPFIAAGKTLISNPGAFVPQDLADNVNKLGNAISSGVNTIKGAAFGGDTSVVANPPIRVGNTGPQFAPEAANPSAAPSPVTIRGNAYGPLDPVDGSIPPIDLSPVAQADTGDISPAEEEMYLGLQPPEGSPAFNSPTQPTPPLPGQQADRSNIDLANSNLDASSILGSQGGQSNMDLASRLALGSPPPSDPNTGLGAFDSEGRRLAIQGETAGTTGDGSSRQPGGNINFGGGNQGPGLGSYFQNYKDELAMRRQQRRSAPATSEFRERMDRRNAKIAASSASFLARKDMKNDLANVKRKDRAGIIKAAMNNAQSEREDIRGDRRAAGTQQIQRDKNTVTREGQANQLAIADRNAQVDAATAAALEGYRMATLGQTQHQNDIANEFKQLELQQDKAQLGLSRADKASSAQRRENRSLLDVAKLQGVEGQRAHKRMQDAISQVTSMEGRSLPVQAKIQILMNSGMESAQQMKPFLTDQDMTTLKAQLGNQ